LQSSLVQFNYRKQPVSGSRRGTTLGHMAKMVLMVQMTCQLNDRYGSNVTHGIDGAK
jgi:hypothetical protein